MAKPSTENARYNGPGKDAFLEACAEYEEHRFAIMRATSLAGHVLSGWEDKGGNKNDIRDGFVLRQMTPEEQRAELRRQARVAGWLGIISEDQTGQTSFIKAFEAPAKAAETLGIGGAPLGSRLSEVRAKTAGFNDGKAKAGPGLQDGLAQYEWEPDSPEALAYAEGWGDGNKLRPPPKVRKGESDTGNPVSEATDSGDPAPAEEAPKQRRGRGAVPALPAPKGADGADNRPGWQGDRDFTDTSKAVPQPPR